jgi:dTDP-4-dehydrorhamnose 3,5-epimerase
MLITPLSIAGAYLVTPKRFPDERGSFCELWRSADLTTELGLASGITQCNLAHTKQTGTIRGMHWALTPHDGVKLFTVAHGRVFDVLADVNPASPTYRQWLGVELSPNEQQILVIPGHCAHGYQTLTDDVAVTYFLTSPYHGPAERGFHYADPHVSIDWPLPVTVVSEKDRQMPELGGE